MECPLVSVVMSVYNDESYVAKSIDSILNQTFEDFEFIIVDDGSTDGTRDVIDRYNDDRIFLIENKENIGLTRSLNNALEHSSGRYVARQDADDISRIDRLERQLSYLDRHPSVAMVGSGAILVDETGNRLERRIPVMEPTLEDLLQKNRFVHGSVLLRSDVLEEVGGYDEYFETVQDYDLWLRIADRYPVRNHPAPLYSLRVHDESIYITKLEQSLLYEQYARDKILDEVSEVAQEIVESRSIEKYRDYLDDGIWANLQRSVAVSSLRYGDKNAAAKACRSAIRIAPLHPLSYLLLGISKVGAPAITVASRSMRAYLNTMNSVRNLRSRLR